MAVDNINQHKSFVQNRRSSLLAAIFLMATSAIGPGFITQTATFTATLGVAFAFGILALGDIACGNAEIDVFVKFDQ